MGLVLEDDWKTRYDKMVAEGRFDTSSPNYCHDCNYDTHRCMGCGDEGSHLHDNPCQCWKNEI